MIGLREVRRKGLALAGDRRFLLCVYVGMTLIGSIQKYWAGEIGTFLNLTTAANKLIEGQDLYKPRYDVYHYTPTFAFFMIPLSHLPTWLSLTLWNLLNAMSLFYAITRLGIPDRKRALICWIILWELLTAIQNYQSNALIAALFLWTFVLLERGSSFWAAFCTMASAFIKVFGVAGALLLPFYPHKKRAVGHLLLWLGVLVLLPCLVVSPGHLVELYRTWIDQLQVVHGVFYGMSVMGILHSWFGVSLPNAWVQFAGSAAVCCPLLRRGQYRSPAFRTLFLGSLTIWAVLFNHKAESPAYVIAMLGVALWFVAQERAGLDRFLLALALLASFQPEFVPRDLRENYVTPYSLKAVPFVLIWLKLQYELLWTDYRGAEPTAGQLSENSANDERRAQGPSLPISSTRLRIDGLLRRQYSASS